jgi:hypothetical protein
VVKTVLKRELMIIHGERKFDQNVLALTINCDWIWPINKCQKCQSMCYCVNEEHDNTNNRLLVFLRQPYTIFSKIVDEGVKAQLLQLYRPNWQATNLNYKYKGFFTRKIGQKVPQMALVRLDQGAI